jgi:hypothetical protein
MIPAASSGVFMVFYIFYTPQAAGNYTQLEIKSGEFSYLAFGHLSKIF